MMPHVRRLALSAALLALAAAPAHAQTVDVSGKWEFTSEGPRGPMTTVFTFAQDGATVTGTAEMGFGRRQGGGGDTPPPLQVSNGKVDGDKLTFTISFSRPGGGGQGMEMTYAATVSGDTMTGTSTTPRGERPFTAKRVE